MRIFFILSVLFFTLSPSLHAQKTRALTRIIKGEVEKEMRDASRRVPAALTAFEAKVVDKSKLQYNLKQLSLMMERDRTLLEKMLSGEMRPEELALEERLRKKVYGVLPPAILPTDEVHLSLAMLSSAQTAKRLAKNGGGKRFTIMSPEAGAPHLLRPYAGICRSEEIRGHEAVLLPGGRTARPFRRGAGTP